MKTELTVKLARAHNRTCSLLATAFVSIALLAGVGAYASNSALRGRVATIAPVVFTPATAATTAAKIAADKTLAAIVAPTAPAPHDYEILAQRLEVEASHYSLYIMLFPEMPSALRAEYKTRADQLDHDADTVRAYGRSLSPTN